MQRVIITRQTRLLWVRLLTVIQYIGVGAVDKNGNITSFSSNGPTSDGKIKPDVVSPGAIGICSKNG